MKLAATPAQVSAVGRLVRHIGAAQRFAFLDHADALSEFQREFENESGIGAATAADLPESFRLQLQRPSQAAAVVRRFRGRAGVAQVNGPPKSVSAEQVQRKIAECRARDFDLEVFLQVNATQAQVDAVRAAMEREPGVTIVRFFNHQQALAKFRTIFSNNTKLRDSVTAADLPESFELRIPEPRQAEVQAMLGGAGGVETVIGPSPICQAVNHTQAVPT